ncbi:hypothetical protein [Micromonospora sp. NPDC005652]|uniref:hypothetical protein n=1 Tax=Micromonospora sp. NPDC005652 TaxID=3157046 RepID=UPI0033EABCCC
METGELAQHVRDGGDIVPAALATVGDLVTIRGVVDHVTEVNTFGPGEHDGTRVHRHMVARQVVTATGDRWAGHAPGGRYRGCEITYREPDGVSFEI